MSCADPSGHDCACHTGGLDTPCDVPGGCGLRRRANARTNLAQEIAVIAAELTTAYSTSTPVDPAAVPGWKPPTGRPAPRKVRHETHAPGLVQQLHDAAGTRPARPTTTSGPVPTPALVDAANIRGPRYGADTTGHTKPGSRPPTNLAAVDTLANIHATIRALRCDAHTAAGRRTITRPAPLHRELEHLAWITGYHRADGTPAIPDRLAQRILHELRGLSADARVVLSYLAPVVTLRVRCPDCGGEMRVREDATSDVWCIGRIPLEGPPVQGGRQPIGHVPCGARWSRFTWVQLLDTTTSTG